ncbi:MAG: type II toxin-antitoxin system prevent-host-death family antitoxin [Caulobacteraceae bacterium]
MEIGVFEAKNRFSELLEAAERGEEVVVTRRGKPVARIVSATLPTSAQVQRRLAAWAEVERIREEISRRNGGVVFDWEDLKKDRDEGRP